MRVTISVVHDVQVEVDEDPSRPEDVITAALLKAEDEGKLTSTSRPIRYEIEISPLELYLSHDSDHWQQLRNDMEEGAEEFNLYQYEPLLPQKTHTEIKEEPKNEQDKPRLKYRRAGDSPPYTH